MRTILFSLAPVALLLLAACKAGSAVVFPNQPPASALSIKDETAGYKFYYAAPGAVTAIPSFKSILEKDAARTKASFLKDYAASAQDRARAADGSISFDYDAAWSRAADAGALASVRLDYYVYQGGAHPLTGMDARIVETATGKVLKLADLLSRPIEQTGLPDALCKAVAEEKSARGMPPDVLGEPLICKGEKTTVKSDGPVIFIASEQKGKAAGLRFLFSPYELGAYVEGPYVVDVPLAAFQGDLKTAYASGFGGAPSLRLPDENAGPGGGVQR